MFITENVKTKTPIITADILYESAIEANEKYHALSIEMIKIEHQCIMNEDTETLMLAESQFMEKVKHAAKVVLDNFLRFIDKVRSEWGVMINKFRKKIVDNIGLKGKSQFGVRTVLYDEFEFKGVSIYNYNKIIEVVDKYKDFEYNELKDLDTNAIFNDLKEEKFVKTKNAKVTSNEAWDARDFIERNYDKMVKDLKGWRKDAIDTYKKDCKESDEKKDNLKISQFARVISKLIILLNKAFSSAFKIVMAVAYGI